ncbi:MAG: aminopeptidase [Polaribacter sp.]|nr:aminopeptidase [Polaribacter sp.]MDG1993415.1 aminopeptidase [Polaribacter sp.]
MKINAVLDEKNDVLKIQQEIVYFNNSNQSLKEIYLHNWANSFKDKNTPLTKRLIGDYDKSLYFAKDSERGFSKILNLSVDYEGIQFTSQKDAEDILKIELNKVLKPADSIVIKASFTVKIPSSQFTSYGKTATGYHLRYWYLTPAVFTNEWQLMSNLNTDDLFINPTNYNIKVEVPNNYFLTSNLTQEKENSIYNLSGNNKTDIILSINKINNYTTYKTNKIDVITDVLPKGINKKLTSDILNRELFFIEKYLGPYPHKELLLDEVSQNKNPIYGLNQLPKFLSPFSDVFDRDITYFKAITRKYLENTLLLNRRKDYWLIDGIQTFLMIEYVKEFYADVKLLGTISKVWGVRSFNFSKLDFNDKYPFVYQFGARKFLDQALTTSLDSLSNFNRKIANKYKAGLGLQYLKGYLGDSIIKESFTEFYSTNQLKISSSKVFNKIISSKTDKDLTWFFGDYIRTNKKIDYTIKKIESTSDSLKISIKNKRNITAPVALYGVKNKKIRFKKWLTGIDSTNTITIAKGNFDKIALNYEQLYPEYNTLDNWKNIERSVLDKPIQLKLIKDIEDPYYNQLFYQPELGYNFYDGVTLGLKLHNKPILSRNLSFKLVPSYATKSKTLTGLASIMYNQYFENSKIQHIVYGVSASNFHYAPELSYGVFAPYISTIFKRKSLRDVGGNSLTVKYVNIHKETAKETISNEQDIYNVLNIKYINSKPNIIEGISYEVNTDISSNFTKFSTDIRYRKLTAKNRQLDFRVFGGFFLNNKTSGDYFSFGLDRSSDYLFEENYFGRSESSGIFSQQVIIEDGGFKSVLPTRFANQYMMSFNSSIGLWNWVEYYNDVAFLKNKEQDVFFAYENGIRFNFIHNILEIYFPMYSNNGWEVTQEAYLSKIRFVLTARPSTIYNFFRRGFL